MFLFGLKGMPVEMGIAVAASAVFLAFAHLDKFSKFKGAGFEAELREVVSEANATVEHLKSVATPLLITNLDLISKEGRLIDGGDFSKNHELFDKLIGLGVEIGLEDEGLEDAKQRYIRIHAWDMVSMLAKNIEKAGEVNFSKLVAEQVGRHNFEKSPDLPKYKSLLSNVELNEECKQQLKLISIYFKKYKL